jgi:hypothetical protein
MTQVGEAVLVGFIAADDNKAKCDFKPDQTNWTANLSGSSEALAASLGNKPHAANEAALSATAWPSQAHHLIPHLTLIDHPVAEWLKSGGSSELWGDTKYNVDHRNNGKWLPYAADMPEWQTNSASDNRKLLFKLMRLSGLQIHQGPHSGLNNYQAGEMPYKACVKKYLDKINQNANSHYKKTPPCTDCKPDGKKKLPPRDNTVRFVDQASAVLWQDIAAARIFVSRIAAEFVLTGGVP